jgi:hypothetical protein
MPDVLHALAAVGPVEVKRALCDIAEQSARDYWRRDRDSITASLRRDLNDEARQREDSAKDIAEYEEALDLAPAARDRFAEEYEADRKDNLDAIRAEIAKSPPDYGAVLASAKDLFATEDRLARQYAGDDGALRLRASQLESRTAILAIAASLAELPLDENVTW